MTAEIAGLPSTNNNPQQTIQYRSAALLRNDMAISNSNAVNTVVWIRTLTAHSVS
jgi:hypothetical protein